MREQDIDAFAKMLQDVFAYYRKDCSDAQIEIYWGGLECYELEVIRAAIGMHMRDTEAGQFEPRIANLVKIIEGGKQDRALLAWSMAQEAASSVGSYQDLIFEDPIIHAVIEDMGGWPLFCRLPEKDLSYHQNRFVTTYRAQAASAAGGALVYPAILRGDRQSDHFYASRGLALPRPTLIGERQRCALTYQGGSNAGRLQTSASLSIGDLTKLALPVASQPAPAFPARATPRRIA